ncbi:MAG: N-acetylmuramoyl-L-alanine amidase [Erysipelotrichales bacterium]|nr:N-acetylmuramoyl-L-alanine amidase [Erysipelotrichales bacterium]
MKKILFTFLCLLGFTGLIACQGGTIDDFFTEIETRLRDSVPENTEANLNLITGHSGSTISWVSSNPLIIDNSGALLESQVKTIITLTASVTFRSETREFSFTTNVGSGLFITRHDLIFDNIRTRIPATHHSDFTAITTISDVAFGSTVRITSQNQNIMNNQGIIFRTITSQDVMLDISITYRNVEVVFHRQVTVLPLTGVEIMNSLRDLVNKEFDRLEAGEIMQLRTSFPEIGRSVTYSSSEIGFVTASGRVRYTLNPGEITIKAYFIEPGDRPLVVFERTFTNPFATDNRETFFQNYLNDFFENRLYISDLNQRSLDIIEDILPLYRYTRPGEIMDVRYIIVHETANTREGAGARGHNAFLQGKRGPDDIISWHFTVDDIEIFQHLPINERANHNMDTPRPNGVTDHGIGIELCVNVDSNFQITKLRGARLVAKIMYQLRTEHGVYLTMNDIRQHNEFSIFHKDCPQIMRTEDTWADFIELVGFELFKIEHPDVEISFDSGQIKQAFNDRIFILHAPLNFTIKR